MSNEYFNQHRIVYHISLLSVCIIYCYQRNAVSLSYISYCTFGWKDNKKLLGLLKHCIYFYCIFSLWKTNIEKVRLHVQQTITLFTNFTFTHHVKALWKFPWRNAEQCQIWSTQETLKHSLIKRIIYHFTSLNQVFGTHALGLNGKWYTCCR